MKSLFAVACVLLLSSSFAFSQQPPADTLGMHNLTPGSGASIYVPSGNLGCTYCHAPHSGLGGVTPLWNQQLSKSTYVPYSSTTYHQTGNTQPPLGVTSSLCLSCHDGTVAVGQTAAYGKVTTVGSWTPGDTFGQDLTSSHPFSLVTPIKDTADLQASLVSSGTTADPLHKVNLVNGNVECTSCHDPHSQSIDPIAQDFLVRDGSSGQICLACHDPNRVVQGQTNLLNGWPSSIHQSAANKVATNAHVGPYATIAQNACSSCHMEHDANGPARLLRQASPGAPGARFRDPVLHDLPQRRNLLLSRRAQRHGRDEQDCRTSSSERHQLARRRRTGRAVEQSPRHLRGLPQRPRFQSGHDVRRAAYDARIAIGNHWRQRARRHHRPHACYQPI